MNRRARVRAHETSPGGDARACVLHVGPQVPHLLGANADGEDRRANADGNEFLPGGCAGAYGIVRP